MDDTNDKNATKDIGEESSKIPQLTVTHRDLEFTPVPLFECVFCVRDVQAQELAFRKVGEESLVKRWRKINKRYLDHVYSDEELQEWDKVLGKVDLEECNADDIQDMIDHANKGTTTERYISKVIQSKALLRQGHLAEYGSGFDELPAPALSKAIHSKRAAKLIQDNLDGRQVKI